MADTARLCKNENVGAPAVAHQVRQLPVTLASHRLQSWLLGCSAPYAHILGPLLPTSETWTESHLSDVTLALVVRTI